jgi:hypothetical protein
MAKPDTRKMVVESILLQSVNTFLSSAISEIIMVQHSNKDMEFGSVSSPSKKITTS